MVAGGFWQGLCWAGARGGVTGGTRPPLTDMPPRQLHGRIPVNIGEQPQAEAL